jgi:hypothetical protein
MATAFIITLASATLPPSTPFPPFFSSPSFLPANPLAVSLHPTHATHHLRRTAIELALRDNADGEGKEEQSRDNKQTLWNNPRQKTNNNPQGNGNNNQQNNGNHFIVSAIITLTSTLTTLASLGTLWSEYSVFTTGCGPRSLPDAIERECYLGVLTVAGLSVFIRIVTGDGFSSMTQQQLGYGDGKKLNDETALIRWMQLAESLSLLAVLGAFVVLGSITIHGEQMDGMSGINVDMCRAIQEMD